MSARLYVSSLLFCLAIGAALAPLHAQESLSERLPFRLYKDAQDQMANHHYAAAANSYKAYLEARPTERDALTDNARFQMLYAGLIAGFITADDQLERYAKETPAPPYAPNAWFALGRHAYEKKRWEKTVAYLSNLHEGELSKEEETEAAFYHGYALLSLKELDKAEPLFLKASTGTGSYTAAANYYMAYLSMRSGRYDQALAGLTKVENDPTYRPQVATLRADIYIHKREYAKALDEVQRAERDSATGRGVSQASQNDELYLFKGEALYYLQNYPAAGKAYGRYLARNREAQPKAIAYHIGATALVNKQADKAIPYLVTAAQNPDTATGKRDTLGQAASFALGQAYAERQNLPYAFSAFAQARATKGIDSLQEKAWFYSGQALAGMARYEEARATLENFKARYPDSKLEAEADETIGESYLYGTDYEAALEHFKKIRSKTPRVLAAYQRVLMRKGQRLYNEHQPGEALPFFEQAIAQPQTATITDEALYGAGEAASATRQWAKAQGHYLAFIASATAQKNPLLPDVYYGLGIAYYNQQQYAKALPAFREYIARTDKAVVRPYYASAMLRLADCLYAAKAYGEADAAYAKAAAVPGGEVDYTLYFRAQVYNAQGKLPEAEQLLDQMLQRYPTSRYRSQAIYLKAQLELDQGNYQNAVTGLTMLINGQQDIAVTPFAYLKRAVAYSNLKEADKASADYKKIIDEFPTSPAAEDAIVGLQESMNSEGKTEDFYGYLSKYKQANPAAGSTETLEFETAKGLYFGQKYAKAITALEGYLGQYPQSSYATEAHFYIAESYYRTNDRTKALEEHKIVANQGPSPYLTRALGRLGEMEHTGGAWEESNRYYAQLLRLARNPKEQAAALAGQMENYYELGAYDSSATFAEHIFKMDKAPLDAQNKATLYRGKVALAQNDEARAQDELLATLNDAKDATGAEAQYLLAEIQYKNKKYKESLESLYALNRNFGQYPRWKDKAFLLIADNFIAAGDSYQAKATLNSIITQSPDKKTQDAARTRLQSLKEETKTEEQ